MQCKEKSARLVVTMGMPAFMYKTFFGAHTAKNLALNLRRCGVGPVRETFVGGVGSESAGRRWIVAMARLVRLDAFLRAGRRVGRVLAGAGTLAIGAYLANVAFGWARFGKAAHARSLLDDVMPEYDVRLDHRVTIHAPAKLTLETLAQTQLERSPLIQALFRARRILLRGAAPPAVPAGGLFEQLEAIGWRIVAQEHDRELVFGAVTTPWKADPEFIGLDAEEFRRFRAPGYVKIAFSLRVEPRGENAAARTQTRALATDPASRRRFRRYWAFLSPGIEIVRVLLLAQLKGETEARQRAQSRLRAG